MDSDDKYCFRTNANPWIIQLGLVYNGLKKISVTQQRMFHCIQSVVLLFSLIMGLLCRKTIDRKDNIEQSI